MQENRKQLILSSGRSTKNTSCMSTNLFPNLRAMYLTSRKQYYKPAPCAMLSIPRWCKTCFYDLDCWSSSHSIKYTHIWALTLELHKFTRIQPVSLPAMQHQINCWSPMSGHFNMNTDSGESTVVDIPLNWERLQRWISHKKNKRAHGNGYSTRKMEEPMTIGILWRKTQKSPQQWISHRKTEETCSDKYPSTGKSWPFG